MVAGLTPAGFTPKTVAEIIAELQQAQRSTVDGTLNTSSTGVLANINMAVALQLGAVWELLAEIYDAHDPDTAEGTAADHNGSLRGITRQAATKAQVILQLTLDPLTTVITGSVVSDPARPTVRFVTKADAVTAAVGGLVLVAAEAETAGTLSAGVGTLTRIESPTSGWTAVTNPAPAIPGSATETDEEYRARQRLVSATTEGATLAGIVADVRLLPNVIAVTGYENVTDVVVDSLPPHSFEIVVSGGTDATIALTIWRNKPAGIETYGNTSVTITDSEGDAHVVRFSRPVTKVVNVNYLATTDSTYVPNSIRTTLEAASINPLSPACFVVGLDVYLVRLIALASEVQGVINVTLDATLAPATPADAIPTSPNVILDIGKREVATFTGATWVGT